MDERTCAKCKHEDLLDYGVTDWCWATIVPKSLQTQIVCMQCFDKMAAEKNVMWTTHLQYVRFMGEAGGFVHYPK